MTRETVKALQDTELAQVIEWAQAEVKARAEKRKQDTIAQIKELAGSVGVSVFIGSGKRGRPSTTSGRPRVSRKNLISRQSKESDLSNPTFARKS